MQSLPTIEGERIRLRELAAADTPGVFAVFGDPEVTRFMDVVTRVDTAHAREMIEEVQALARRDELYQWGIALRASDEIVGTITLASLDPNNRRAELGFALARGQRGQGYATEAVRVVLEHAFGAMSMHRIEADVDPRNATSIALLERVGFRKEGYMPERWLNDGEWQDTVFYGLLASQWSARE